MPASASGLRAWPGQWKILPSAFPEGLRGQPATEGKGKNPVLCSFSPRGGPGGLGGRGRGYGGGDALDFGRNWRRIYRSDTLRQSVRPPHFTAFFRLFGQGILL